MTTAGKRRLLSLGAEIPRAHVHAFLDQARRSGNVRINNVHATALSRRGARGRENVHDALQQAMTVLIGRGAPGLLHYLATLLAGQPADDPDRLMDAGSIAKAQTRVVFAFQHFVVLDQGFT